jgi:hypothetical protein
MKLTTAFVGKEVRQLMVGGEADLALAFPSRMHSPRRAERFIRLLDSSDGRLMMLLP